MSFDGGFFASFDIGFAVAKFLFFEYYKKPQLEVVKRDINEVIFSGTFFEVENEIRITRADIFFKNPGNPDKEERGELSNQVMNSVWDVMEGKRPVYSRALIDFCPYMLALFIHYEGRPHLCRKHIFIHDSEYLCEFHGGNDMWVNGMQLFATQRLMFYAAMEFGQNIFKKQHKMLCKEIRCFPGIGIDYKRAAKSFAKNIN